MTDEATIETIAISAAANAIRRGDFDREIEAVAVDTVRNGPDTNLTRVGFILKMAVEAMDRSSSRLSFSKAKEIASRAYQEFRRDNGGVKFGAPGWDWTGAGARTLIHEYEIAHWERA